MGWKLAGFLFPLLLLVLSANGTNFSRNESSPDIHGLRPSRRVVRLYSGTRPKPIVCAGEGFQADPTDCSIFHRCMRTGNGRYVSFRFQCGPGTIYDSDKEICSHPRNTKRTECGGSDHSPRELSVDNEISKEVPSPLSTKHPEGTEKYEFTKQTTKNSKSSSLASNYPWLSTAHQFLNPAISTYNPLIDKRQHTKSPKASSIKREVAASTYTTTSLQKLFPTTAKIDFQNSSSKSQSGDICTSNGFIGDSENCRKFYRCISNQRGGFLRYEFMCSDPTIWDDDKQACNHVWAVKRRRCGRENYLDSETRQNIQVATSEYTPTSQSTILPTQSQLQINYGSKVTQVQTQISNGSVIQNQTQINYGDSITYDKLSILQNQTQISAGDAVSQTQTQINYGNEAIQTQLQIDHSKDSSQAQTQISQSTSTSKTTQFNAHQSISTTSSNNECTESGFMGDSNDCKKFYRCVDNGRGSFTKYEFTCGEGTVWDPKIEACNHAWAVKECGGKIPSETSTQSASITTQGTTTISQSSPTFSMSTSTTQSYYSSVDPEPEDNNDISYGNQPVSASTNKPIEQVTDENKEPQNLSDNKCTSSGFMGDSTDCKKFYRCVDNGNRGFIRYEFTCGEGTVWDQSIEACNHAWAVKNCGNNAEIEKQTEKSTTTNGLPTSNAQTTSESSSQNDDFDTGYGQQPQQDEVPSTLTTTTAAISTTLKASSSASFNVENTCTSSGFIGDNNDCKKFYRCVDNGNGGYTKYEFSCGEGTVWDPEIQACNHAWAVKKCGGSLDINKEETTTLKEPVISSSATPTYVPDNNNDAGHSQQTQEPHSTNSSTSQPEQQNLENNDCKNSGFMGDKQDCNKFHRCVDDGRGGYTQYDFTCGEGTVWDQSIEACNHPWAVSGHCSGSGSYNDSSEAKPATPTYTTSIETEGEDQGYQKPATETTSASTSLTSAPSGSQCTREGFYGDENNCKMFYRCVDNGQGGFVKHEFTCGEGTVWNQDIQTCDHESSNSQCSTHATGSTTKQANKENDEMLTESTTKTSVMSTTNDGNTNTTSQKPSLGNKCENEGFYGDSTDCKKFYRCVDNGKGDFTKYDFTCGDGTIWDQEILACNHENSDNKCGTVSSTTTTGVPEREPGGSQTTQESQTTQKPGIITDPGNDQCTTEGFFANTKDCNKFYRCVDNGKGGFTKYDFACGEGTVWVQEIQACDYDNGISSCSNKESSSKPTTIKDEKFTTSSSSTSPATTVSQHVDKVDDEYPSESSSMQPETDEKCTTEGFFGNINDCTRFYRCVDNGQGGYTKYDFTCGEGTAWDSNVQTCNHINEVETCQNTNQNGQAKPNDEGSTQTSEPTSKPSSSSSNNDKCEEEGYFGNKNDCTMFYRCVDNGKGSYTKYEFTCGEGTIWDQDLLTCNHPQNVVSPSCKNSENGQSSPETSSSTENSSSASSLTTSQSSQGTTESSNQASSNCSQESTSKKPENQKVKCEKAGFFADPDDCKKFYRCVDWDGDGKRFSIYHFDCGEGTIWDPQLETCNHEDSVYPPRDCSGSQSGNVSGETTSTTTTTEIITTSEQSSTTESTLTTQSSTEESTTQQSSSSEQTTQQSTTEKTTTQETSSSEQTTTEKTTTTQQSTSTEKTTTQQPTTSEKTTSQPTTTEQTTTSQLQTTQETATSQQTTTQQTTSSEATTTEQTTTTDQTTTQHTTTEQTTQQMTTNEPTTQSSSTEQTTSQQSTTTEESNTDSSTSEQQTTTELSSTTTEQSTEQNTTEHEKTTTEGSTTTTESNENTTTDSNLGATTQATSSEKECPETEDDQYMYVCPTSFRRHPKYCNMFYQCTEDNDSHDVKVTMFKCPNNTIYDESQTQCVEEDKADKKCDGQTAQRHRVKRLNSNFKEPIEASRGKHTCSTVGNYPYETDNECAGIFLKCQMTKTGKLRAYVYRCPEGYTYWSVSKRCEKTNHMRDCKQSGRSWRDRWEVPIEKKNIAK